MGLVNGFVCVAAWLSNCNYSILNITKLQRELGGSHRLCLKVKVIPKEFTILSPPMARKQWVFHSSKFQSLKCLLFWKNWAQKKPKILIWRSPFWNCTWQPGFVYVASFHPTLARSRKPAWLTWQPSQSQQNVFFLQAIITSLSSLISFSGFGAAPLAQKNMA